jgi:hypothetical protein
MSNPLKLEDLIPQSAEIHLSSTGKSYKLRPFSLEDEAWLSRRFGKDLPAIFSEMRMADIAEIAFHQFELEDKRQFVAQEVTIVDEAGNERTERMGGAVLFRMMIRGLKEKNELYAALLQTIGISRPVQDQLAADVSSEKKRIEDNLKSEPTGEQSSMPLPVNTDGVSQKSAS